MLEKENLIVMVKQLRIPGSNIPLSAAGVLILWLGWFGFNGGSVLSADPAILH